ncbi:response regulator, partial [Listeria monocytogenes]|nr:response regulator [Listeria monocytogenes]
QIAEILGISRGSLMEFKRKNGLSKRQKVAT